MEHYNKKNETQGLGYLIKKKLNGAPNTKKKMKHKGRGTWLLARASAKAICGWKCADSACYIKKKIDILFEIFGRKCADSASYMCRKKKYNF